MIYKTYKITYEKLSKIIDLSIFKDHINIGKSFSFLIEVNSYSNEIESIEICDENRTPLFLSGDCDSIIDVYDYKDTLIGEVHLPSLNRIDQNSSLLEYKIDYGKINGLLKSYIENVFKKKISYEESIIDRNEIISRLQEILISEEYNEEILNITGYDTLNDFFKNITKDLKNYTRKNSSTSPIPYNTNEQESRLNVNVEKYTFNEDLKSNEQNSISTLKTKSTIGRLEFLKNRIKELNAF